MVRVKASQNALNLRPAMYCPLSVPLEGRRGETTARYSVEGVQAIEKECTDLQSFTGPFRKLYIYICNYRVL